MTNKVSDLIPIYISYKEDGIRWLNLHRQHFTQFVTLILIVLGITMGALFQYFDTIIDNGTLVFIILMGPILNIILSIVGIFTCTRFYRRFLEHTTIGDKLFFLLDKEYAIDSKVASINKIFPDDEQLYLNRWKGDAKPTKYLTADSFVEYRKYRGSNKFILLTFILLIIINTGFIAGVLNLYF